MPPDASRAKQRFSCTSLSIRLVLEQPTAQHFNAAGGVALKGNGTRIPRLLFRSAGLVKNRQRVTLHATTTFCSRNDVCGLGRTPEVNRNINGFRACAVPVAGSVRPHPPTHQFTPSRDPRDSTTLQTSLRTTLRTTLRATLQKVDASRRCGRAARELCEKIRDNIAIKNTRYVVLEYRCGAQPAHAASCVGFA